MTYREKVFPLGNGVKAVGLILLILVVAVGGYFLYNSGMLEPEEKKDDSKKGSGDDNILPVASFSSTHAEAVVGENITFNAELSSDEDGEVVRYKFNFGDSIEEEFTKAEREAADLDMIAWHNYTIANTYTVTLEVYDDNDPVGKSDPKTIQVKILPSDYQASDNYFLSARAIATKEVNFTLENDAISCEVNVSFDARMGVGEECSASVWLANPYGDIIMNETVTLGALEGENFGIIFNPTQLSTIGLYNLILQCTEGRVQYSYDILVDY